MLELITKYPLISACIIYVLVISLISIIVTIYDKKIAGTGKRRVPEATLLMWSALGGSVAMLFLAYGVSAFCAMVTYAIIFAKVIKKEKNAIPVHDV
jgi:uncharacterized membrane protein YsdA (DUF1294 family)